MIERSFQGFSVAIETVRIVEELVEIWLNEVCNTYYQGGRMVDDYLDNFQALVSNAGYTDPQMLVVKF